MNNKMPSIIITGASGFIGRFLLESLKEEAIVYAIARRSRKESNIPFHKNIRWIQCDIANRETLTEVRNYISENGGVDYIIHLAAFYDFTYKENPEYKRTNIEGTKNILELSLSLKPQRFIFASSLAACKFPENGNKVSERSLPDAEFAYAKSKKAGEEMIKDYSKYFPCTVLRFAAVYSDWCEYAPLYKFLLTWLSRKIDSRLLAGNGESSIPYIHIQDVTSLIRVIIKKTDELNSFSIFNASPDGSVSHKELFKIATAYYFGKNIRPFFIPKFLIYPGLAVKKILKHSHVFCEEPFEEFWMLKYIDKKLEIDSEFTRNTLKWAPAPRYHITRRLLFLLEKIKSHPDEWRLKNEAALKKASRRDNLIIYEALTKKKEVILLKITDRINSSVDSSSFLKYKNMNQNDFQCYMSTLYHLLMATVRSGDRSLMLQYIDDIAMRRFAEGFLPDELCETLSLFKEIIIPELLSNSEFKNIQQIVYDYIGLTLQLAQDEVEDIYERILQKIPRDKISESELLPDCKELQRMIRQLSAFYQISRENGKYYEEVE